MDARPRPLPPLLTLSTRASPLLRLPTLAAAARGAALDGLDLDLSNRPLPEPADACRAAAQADLPIRSVWLPRGGFWTGWHPDRGRNAATAIARACGASTLVVHLPADAGGRPSRAGITGLTESLRALVHPATRLCVGIGPKHLEGGRPHLVQLTALRRLAEEWDFEVALDLAGPIDPRWEAEAAVARLGGRLGLIRLDAEVAAGLAHGRARAVARALAAAIDGGHPTEFALVPRPPAWRWRRERAMTSACLVAGRRIRTRYAAVEEQRLVDAYPPPTPRHPGQRPA